MDGMFGYELDPVKLTEEEKEQCREQIRFYKKYYKVIMDGKYYRGMTNIGLRPSDDDIPIPTVETFLLNFDQDIYGRQVILEVFVYIRGVKKFAGGLDEVRKQIDKDIEQVRTYMDEVIRKLEA